MTFSPPLPLDTSTVQLIEWQSRAVDEIVEKLSVENKQGVVLRGGTGLGKMYIKCLAIRELLDKGLLHSIDGSVNPFPVLWLCHKSVRQQTLSVQRACGIAHLCITYSYGQIKNSDGTDNWIEYKTILLPGGQPSIIPTWYPHMLPSLLVCDEIQSLKNPESLQSKVVRHCPPSVKWIGASATPWQRVADARTTIERCGVITRFNALPCTITVAPAVLRDIAHPKSPDKYSPSSVERLRNTISDYIVELKGVRFKFPSQTRCKTIYFRNSESRMIYEHAYEEYLEALRKRGDNRNHGAMARLVAMQKFQQKAELLRCDQIAESGLKAVGEGKQVIIASNYKDTLRSVWTYLVKVHKVPANRITFVVGGQSEKDRELQRQRFQAGDSDYILFTMRSGGVGISLHHDRVSTRPRHVILPPTWSAIDLVQALGRAHRLTSLSPTVQEILWFGDTVEDRVKEVVEQKVKCISKSVTAKEQFMGIFERISEEEQEELEELEHRGENNGNGDPDLVNEDDSITGEGLESVEDSEMPTKW